MADTLGPLRPDEEKLYEGQPKGFPLGDYKSYLEDVMLPEGDDMGIPSDDAKVYAYISCAFNAGSAVLYPELGKKALQAMREQCAEVLLDLTLSKRPQPT